MKDYLKEYDKWLQHKSLDQSLIDELEQIKDNANEIEEKFYKDLEFGTGGLRGIIGAGTNRMNIYTIRKATLGLANYIIKQGQEAMNQGVVIAYDSRKFSKEFAEETARVLATCKIKVYLFDELRPTPILSFAVRHLQTFIGIVITASHNPPEYNGYKVYNKYGGQITDEMANCIYSEINKIENILEFQVNDLGNLLKENIICYVGNEIDYEYRLKVEKLLLNEEIISKYGAELKIIYTPLHGSGNKPVTNILNKVGFSNLYVVKDQELPDPQFSTVKAPNPEDREVYNLAVNLAEMYNADLIMATDPDADRLGVLVKINEEYKALNGNQLGALILHYLLSQKAKKGLLPKNSIMVKTIVTSELGKLIADKYNIPTENTLTGFKYIGEKIKEYHEEDSQTFIFGYEESYGYLAGDFVRDKDAVQIAVIVAEMALVYKKMGKTLFNLLEDLYQEFGYHVEDLVSVTLKGIEGITRINEIVSIFRDNPPKEINGIEVEVYEDYLINERVNILDGTKTTLNYPKSNVIKLILKDKSWVAIRPSGTEPKLKFYFAVVSDRYDDSMEKLNSLKSTILAIAKL